MKLERHNNRFPLKVVLLPEPKVASKNIFWKAKNTVKSLFWKKTRLYFVCSVSYQLAMSGPGPEKAGYELNFDTNLLKRLKPVVALSAILAKAVLCSVGVPPLVLPFPQGLITSNHYCDALSEYASKNLQDKLEDHIGALMDAENPVEFVESALEDVYTMLLRYH